MEINPFLQGFLFQRCPVRLLSMADSFVLITAHLYKLCLFPCCYKASARVSQRLSLYGIIYSQVLRSCDDHIEE